MNIGKMIYGFCNGFFGRDDYNTKIIVFETDRAICCRYVDCNDYNGLYGCLTVANFENEEEKNNYIKQWEREEN